MFTSKIRQPARRLLARWKLWLRARHLGGGRPRIALALFLVVAASVLFWASRDYTIAAPDWDGQVRGIAYSPSHTFTDHDRLNITPEQIDRDMAQLAQITGHIRTYTVAGGMDKVPSMPPATV